MFQSLLYWISHCGTGSSIPIHAKNSFQSLLYWISHCGSGSKRALALAPIRFNPCCIGLAIAAPGESCLQLPAERFQSLLYWISHCGALSGCGETRQVMFQSLLYWISHCGAWVGLEDPVVTMFQSLLYWISHCGTERFNDPA